MREPDSASAWAEWDAQQDDERIRGLARSAQTEDQYLDALRDAGSLGAGIAVVTGPSQLSDAQRRTIIDAHLAESERLRRQAEARIPDSVREQYRLHYERTMARLAAFRVLGHGPALSEEWRIASGNWGCADHDYPAAIAAELKARKEAH